MEVCEDMPLVNLRKRQFVNEMTEYPNCKRLCTETRSLCNGNGRGFNQMNDRDAFDWQMQMSADKKLPIQQCVPGAESHMDYTPFESHERTNMIQPCPRCIAGESGHINHIMRI